MQTLRNIALALLLLAAPLASAQVVAAPVQYVLDPELPGPRQTVRIEAQGVGTFLGSANIVWSQDGRVLLQGVGERKFSFITGALGSKTTVRVDIDSSEGRFTKTWVFSPSTVNLLWEADTTVPPFYLGKALYSGGSSYKVVAYPTVYNSSGARILPSALGYQWSRTDKKIPDQSGLGRNVLRMTGDQLQQSEDIAVDVYYGAAKVARGEISIAAATPGVVLYERDALRGVIYDTALPQAISLTNQEITIQAEPFYFSNAAKRNGLLPFSWTLNDQPVTGPDTDKGILTLRQSGSGSGTATLGVSVQNTDPDQFVQTANTTLQLVFGTTGNTFLNFFGI